ncbi:MAG: hypothetical protein N4R92_03125 [Lactobacillus crispatus]|nr:hypothetical protein [Lactobacillus crispatus]
MELTGKKENFEKFIFKVDELGYAIDDLLPSNWMLNLKESSRLLSDILSDNHLKVKQETKTTSDNLAIQIKTILEDSDLQVSTSSVTMLDSNDQVEYILNWWQWRINCQLALISGISSIYESIEN